MDNREQLKGLTINVLDKGYVRLIDFLGSDTRIVEAARVSYSSPSKGDEADKKLLKYLVRNRHTSPQEQASITFNIKLPLFVQGQMVRHRTQRLNQVSARYTEMKDEFYYPKTWRKQDNKNKQGSIEEEGFNPITLQGHNVEVTANEDFEDSCRCCYSTYERLLAAGVAREMARMVLPQNLYTEIYTNFDLHNLMHFLILRMDKHAQFEIQEYARAMFKIMEQLYPWCGEIFREMNPELFKE